MPAKVRSVVPLLRVEAHQPRDEDRQVHLPAYSLDDCQPACRLADRHHIAVAERRERDEAEVDRLRQAEGLRTSERPGVLATNAIRTLTAVRRAA